MTHAGMTAEARSRAGITDNLIRLSVGVEDTADLLADFQQALDAVLEKELVAEEGPSRQPLPL